MCVEDVFLRETNNCSLQLRLLLPSSNLIGYLFLFLNLFLFFVWGGGVCQVLYAALNCREVVFVGPGVKEPLVAYCFPKRNFHFSLLKLYELALQQNNNSYNYNDFSIKNQLIMCAVTH